MNRYGLLVDGGLEYPKADGLFRPGEAYPEYPFPPESIDSRPNVVYDGVRRLLQLSGLDESSFGTPEWNPLGEYVRPGDKVLVKPNLVSNAKNSGGDSRCLYTHPSVIAAAIDYVWIALRGRGLITVADAPVQTCDFDDLVGKSGLKDMIDWYQKSGVRIELKDLRGLRSRKTARGLEQVEMFGDGGVVVDLGVESSFHGLSEESLSRLRITNYDPRELIKHHTRKKHEYCIARELLDSDVVINLPKAKTHRKAGVTGALKNMVGINVRKEYLPHHCNGSQEEGYDGYAKRSRLRAAGDNLLDLSNKGLGKRFLRSRELVQLLSRIASFLGKKTTSDNCSEGSWYGNDTIWRTVLDLNKIAFHADKQGVMREEPQRRMVVLCDMVTIGQGEGPLVPEPSEWKMLAFSDSPVLHDAAMARLFGTDESLIPTVHKALHYEGSFGWPEVPDIYALVRSNDESFDEVPISMLNEDLNYVARPASGWLGHFERSSIEVLRHERS